MIRMHLRAADLAETWFAISPLGEASYSLWVRRRPGRQPLHLPWRRATQPAYRALDPGVLEVLEALVAPNGWLPDFISPRPVSPVVSVAEELAALGSTDGRRARRDIEAAYDGAAVPAALQGRGTVARVEEALECYWHACVEPSWPRMQTVLEADIVYRARQLALRGAAGLFDELDELVHWDDGYLYLDRFDELVEVEVDGRGLPLLPSAFVRRAVTNVSLHLPPTVSYPVRGLATLWEPQLPSSPAALTELIGGPRARLLTVLGEPASTAELAQRLGVTPSAVSQHLGVLHRAGLLTRARSGRSVLYLRSALGDSVSGGR